MPGYIDEAMMYGPDMGGASGDRMRRGKRAKPTQIVIPYGQQVQQAFDWEAKAVPDASKTIPPAPLADAPTSGIVQRPPPLACSLRDAVEQLLKDRKITYINIDEAKRTLYGGQKLKTFHFLVYRQTGPNWLLFCGQPRKADREDLKEWQRIFGDGFVPIIAKRRADGSLHFETLSGGELNLA